MPISEDNTKKFFNEVSNTVDTNVKKATLMVERDAKILCPVLTGTLKRSITHAFPSPHTAIVGSNVEYAPHVELGTSKMSPRSFLRAALAKNMRAIKKLLT
ncbi:hypothetical protein LCGC14_1220030 [marine sediment metagenome]|uniref:HK97 gp10 family phage protein n=1 Tax=marine sediment metagenome TaxID=412755 RepID=A0A0F9PG46_9ZZZZ